MLWFTPYKKTKLEICKVLVIGARVPDLRYQVDSYDWNELPDDLNLSYYDSVILYLDSLERKPSNSLPTRKLTRKMVGRFLFQKNCELVAVGNPKLPDKEPHLHRRTPSHTRPRRATTGGHRLLWKREMAGGTVRIPRASGAMAGPHTRGRIERGVQGQGSRRLPPLREEDRRQHGLHQ